MIKTVALVLMKGFLNFMYLFFKLFPTQNKIVFITRLENFATLDFELLSTELKNSYPNIKVKLICKRLKPNFKSVVAYSINMLSQMYHIATCRLLVLDGYNIISSMLIQKKSLKVLQLWHALGLFKKFGHMLIGAGEGSDPTVASVMKMHYGYNYAVCSSPYIIKEIAKAYNMDENKVLAVGLPRIDYLTKQHYINEARKKIFATYPQLDNNKKTILYVPTFRKYQVTIPYEKLISSVDYEKYNLVVKLHNGNEFICTKNSRESKQTTYKGADYMSVSDYVISDYSAVIFEALSAKKPLLLYCFDYDTYADKRGFFLDYHSIPAIISSDMNEILNAIDKELCNEIDATDFMKKYVPYTDYNITKSIINIMITMYNGKEVDKNNLLLK